MDKYSIGEELGQGTFGVVVKGREKRSGKLVALKKFVLHDRKEGFPITAFREITILKLLVHVNVIQILDVIFEGGNFYTVAPYISCDLNGVIHNPNINLQLGEIKCIMNQVLLGLEFIHNSGYLHRDIKSANILLDWFGTVKIADFGLARKYHGEVSNLNVVGGGGGFVEYTAVVVTRWYRAPELLLGDRKYTTSIDIWGVGCVLAEMIIKRPLFEGKSDIHQAELIFQLLGSPTVENYPDCHLVNHNNVNLKVIYKREFESRFNDEILGIGGGEFLQGLLELDPKRRLNAKGGLKSAWFSNNPIMSKSQSLQGLEDSHESDVGKYDSQQGMKPIPTKPAERIWNKPTVGLYNYDLNGKRDREDPYYYTNNNNVNNNVNGKRQRQNQRQSQRQTVQLYGSSQEDEQKRLSLLRGMLQSKKKM